MRNEFSFSTLSAVHHDPSNPKAATKKLHQRLWSDASGSTFNYIVFQFNQSAIRLFTNWRSDCWQIGNQFVGQSFLYFCLVIYRVTWIIIFLSSQEFTLGDWNEVQVRRAWDLTSVIWVQVAHSIMDVRVTVSSRTCNRTTLSSFMGRWMNAVAALWDSSLNMNSSRRSWASENDSLHCQQKNFEVIVDLSLVRFYLFINKQDQLGLQCCTKSKN